MGTEVLISVPVLYQVFGNLKLFVIKSKNVRCAVKDYLGLHIISAYDYEWYGPYLTLGVLSRDEVTQEDIDVYLDALDFYIGGLQNYNEEHLPGITDMLTDAWFTYGTHK